MKRMALVLVGVMVLALAGGEVLACHGKCGPGKSGVGKRAPGKGVRPGPGGGVRGEAVLTGVVVSVATDENDPDVVTIVVKTRRGAESTVKTDGETNVTLNGESAGADELAPGDQVRVTGQAERAKEIVARRATEQG